METNEIEKIRHSLAHLLAAAIVRLYPDALPTLGPAIDAGFYYDFDFKTPISDKDFEKIENKMREIAKHWKGFEKKEVSLAEAQKLFANNPYKLELIEEISGKGEPITTYTSGTGDAEFTDLCRGGHADDMNKIPTGSWKLERVAGAYWRGDEKNKMLTRVYGLAFESKEALEEYEKQQEEARKRDHRVLGKQLELFTFSPLVGSGLPLWLPKGATVRREIERFIVDTELKWGYLHVNTPDLAKIELYKTSGHYPYYKDSMYPPIKIDEEEFMLRPMTCPHHFQIFTDKPRTYKELPMRIAELAKLYRYEASGELTGLVRVRGFCLADAHIICADKNQAKTEVKLALDLIDYVSKVFGLKQDIDYWYRLSKGDRNDEKKYYKNDKGWDEGEQVLREVLQERNCKYYEADNEAAFYGPKIDVQMKDVRGKENTAFTVQYDFCLPDRFDLKYINKEGKEQRAIVVHRSSVGAIERVMAFLIEHFAGNFPTWLAPVQVKVIPVRTNHNDYAQKVYETLRTHDIRVDFDDDDENLGKKVRSAKNDKIPYWIVIGDKEVEANVVTLESRDGGQLGQMTVDNLVAKLTQEIKERK